MAEESSGSSSASPAPGRAGPVLVPQAALLGKPDISLGRSVITVGSRPSCRLHLVSRSVSQFHALFINSSGSVAVCDLASRVGVQVNGKLSKFAELKSGDRVQVGKFLFRFRAPRPEAVALPPDPAVLDVPGDLPVPLDGRILLVGRRQTCDLPLTDDVDVSTVHAILFQLDGLWIIRDFESRTGTRLNGQRIHQSKLAFGDSISIGKSTFVFSPATDVPDTSLSTFEAGDALRVDELKTVEAPPVSEPAVATQDAVVQPEETFTLEPLALEPEIAELPAGVPAVLLPESASVESPADSGVVDEIAAAEETPSPVQDEADAVEPPAPAPEALPEDSAPDAPLLLAEDSSAIETVDFGEVAAPTAPEPEKPVRKRGGRRRKSGDEAAPARKKRQPGRSETVTPVVMDVVDTLAAGAMPEPPAVASAGVTLLPEVAAAIELGDDLPPSESINSQDVPAIASPEGSADDGAPTMAERMPATVPVSTAEPVVVTVADTRAAGPVDTPDTGEPISPEMIATESEEPLARHWIVENDASPVEPAAPDSPGAAEPVELHGVTEAAYADLAALADDEEFVAIPETEPAEMQSTKPATWPVEDVPVADPAAEASSLEVEPETPDAVADAVPDVAPAADAELLGDDVGFHDLTPGTGPPLFGFDFGAGSFLGGMPLSLGQPAPPGKTGSAIDAKSVTPTTTTPDSVARPTPSAATPPAAPPTARAALVDLDESSLMDLSGPAPLPPGASPFTTAGDEPLTSSGVRPPINTLADEVAIPPLVNRPAAETSAERPALTTAFDGLASGLGAGGATRNVDVFSQMAPPILDELFGSRRGDPAEVVLPDKQPPIPPAAARRDPPPPHIPPVDRAAPARPARPPVPGGNAAEETSASAAAADEYAPPSTDRFARLPTLLLLMVLSMVAAGMAIYFFLPPPVDIRGTLVFENLSKQPVLVQRQFYVNQVQRLESHDVRTVARAILAGKSIGPGFIDDDMEFARVVVNADWNDDVMTLRQTATDEYAGRARVGALLEALARKDADLNDALARARRAAADAHDAVAAQQQKIARIRADRETQVRIGDAAPRLEDVAVLEREANQLDAAWVAAKTLRSDAQSVLDKLRQSDPKAAADSRDDPVLAEQRAHLQQAEVKQALARASTEPAADIDAAAADVNETRSAIDRRLGLLQAEQTETPDQRTASRQAAIETQSIRLATLQSAEADTASAAQAAAVKARDQRTLLEAGRMASVQVEELIRRQELAEHALREFSEDQSAKDDAVNQCVRVADQPQVDGRPGRDIRPFAGAFGCSAIILFFGVVAAMSTRPAAPAMPLSPAAAVPAAPLPVFGINRKPPRPNPNPTRPRDTVSPKPDQVSAGD